MTLPISIAGRRIGPGEPAYVIAELSANHNQDYERAVDLIHAAKAAGADAVKLQTYTPDSITIDSESPPFRVKKGMLWEGKTLYKLYGEAYTPWEWQPRLAEVARKVGLHLFSSPFDASAVAFLEKMNVPAYKIASFELVDIPLIEQVARTGKPVIMSTGMATLAEIDEAVRAARGAGARELALLKCNSGYPAPASQMNLRSIPHMSQTWGLPVGLSDHTLGIAAAVASVALGGCIIEKHLTVTRAEPGPDSAFSLEPEEFALMVRTLREAEAALGEPAYGPTEQELGSIAYRRSLYVVRDVRAGDLLTAENIRSIRPAGGLHTRHYVEVIGMRATRDIAKGTPLTWDLVGRL